MTDMYVPHTSSYSTLRIVGLTLGLEPNPDANGSCGDSLFLFGLYIVIWMNEAQTLTNSRHVAARWFRPQGGVSCYNKTLDRTAMVKIFLQWLGKALPSADTLTTYNADVSAVDLFLLMFVSVYLCMSICVCVHAYTWEPSAQCLWVFVPGLARHAGSQWRRPRTRRHLTKECNDLGAGVAYRGPYPTPPV